MMAQTHQLYLSLQDNKKSKNIIYQIVALNTTRVQEGLEGGDLFVKDRPGSRAMPLALRRDVTNKP